MPLILDPKSLSVLRRKRRIRSMAPMPPAKRVERQLMGRMADLWRSVLLPATERIRELIRGNAPVHVIADAIEEALRRTDAEYAAAADNVVDKWKMSLDDHTRYKFQEALRQTLGVDLSLVLDQPYIRDALAVGGMEAANLIKTIPREHLGKVARAVADNFAGKNLPGDDSLLREIQRIGGVTQRRARLIARDQTSKMTGELARARQTAIGVEGYVWRTSRDERVAGAPGTPAPDPNSRTHGNHHEREGKSFWWAEPTDDQRERHPDWLDPPPDGPPGQAIQCRCHAQPIIDVDRIIAQAEGVRGYENARRVLPSPGQGGRKGVRNISMPA